MGSRNSRVESECGSQGLAELVGCSSDHYIQTVVGNFVRRILDIGSQGRPSLNYKPLSAVYDMKDANAAALHDRTKMRRGDISYVGGIDMSLEQIHGHSINNNTGILDKTDLISSNKISDWESDSDCEDYIVENMTLGELQTWCKAKRQKVMMSPSKSVNGLGMNGQPQNAEADLDEPLIILKHKVSKHAMPKREQVKKGNVSLTESSPSCLVSVEDSRDLQFLDSDKAAILDISHVDWMTNNATESRDAMEVTVHNSSHFIVPVSRSNALHGCGNEFSDTYVESEYPEKVSDQDSAGDAKDHNGHTDITFEHHHENDLDSNCISCTNQETSGLINNEEYDKEMILCNHDYIPPFHINGYSISGEISPVSSRSSDLQHITSTFPPVDNNMTVALRSCSSSFPEEIKQPCTEAARTCPSMVINTSNKEQPKEIDMHASHLCNGTSADSSADYAPLKTMKNTGNSTVDDEHFRARLCKIDSSYVDSQGQKGTELFDCCSDKELRRPPKRFPSNRKVLSPTSKEKLFQAVDAEELYENMRLYRNRKRLWFDKWPDSSSLSDCREHESVITPEKIISKSRIESGNICKGILKSSFIPSVKSSHSTENPLISSHAQDAIKFSQQQMRDIESITAKLLSAVKSMKSIMEETLNLEEFSSAPLRSTVEKMIAAQQHAASAEVTTENYLFMMNRDFKRFCKIMRSKECWVAVKQNDAPKERKKITFADEAGGLLCHVKVFEEHSSTVASDSNRVEGDSFLMQTAS